jgi:hypothetical protein
LFRQEHGNVQNTEKMTEWKRIRFAQREALVAESLMRSADIRVLVDDPFDGLMRIIGDAQRFGFGMEQASLAAESVNRWAVLLTLTVPSDTDDSLLVARFARHPAVIHVATMPMDAKLSLEGDGGARINRLAA